MNDMFVFVERKYNNSENRKISPKKIKMLQNCKIENARFSKVAFTRISPKSHFSKSDKNVIRLKNFF
jgi:hypothetical protein